MSTLLFEIGCEELPATVCVSIERQLLGAASGAAAAKAEGAEAGIVRRQLEAHRLWPARGATLRVLVSPRRIGILVDGVPTRQTVCVQRFRGPRAAVAFDDAGAPTRAGLGFATAKGVQPQDLGREEIDGTEFVTAEVEEPRRGAGAVVPDVCTAILEQIHVPRGMRWGARPPGAQEYLRFSRPIRWLVCKLDARTVPFAFYDMQAGELSHGHRVLGGAFGVTAATEYESLLEGQGVIVDQQRRRRLIEAGLDEQAAQCGGEWFDPGDVVSEATYLAEWPTVHHGTFAEDKLRLPADVLITAMQSHQRYFPVRDAGGALLPVFLYVSNADPAHADLITAGNRRVLEGRLDDAGFAYDRDVAEGLEAIGAKLGAVVFHEKLGTLADKTTRLQELAAKLAELPGVTNAATDAAGAADSPALADTIVRAAGLAKADLASGVVQEFPVLQGRMGELYAQAAGLPDEVAAAVGEHYRPLSATAPVPATLGGALLAVADKIDNIVGAWVAGEKPTGSRDPYGLRRAAMGLVRIALEYRLTLSIAALIEAAREAYERQGRELPGGDAVGEMLAFIWERLEVLLLDEGLDYDSVEAALGSSATDVPGVAARARAIAGRRERPSFTDVVTVYNRCASLAAKAGASAGRVSGSLLIEPAERSLYDAHVAVEPRVHAALDAGDVVVAVDLAATLREPVDRYFDDVLVMDGDPDIRQNRLAQLAAVRDLLRGIGDLSRIPV